MLFGYSIGDFVLVTQLAYSVVINARKACGAHSALAREVNSLHVVLVRLESEVSRPESILSGEAGGEDGDERLEKRKELSELVRDCEQVLKILAAILKKYNALSDDERSVKKLWQKVRFGNGEMQDLTKIRSELATHTQAITLFLNLLGLGSQGKVERYMENHGAELREIKASLNWATAKMQVREGCTHGEKSILTNYVGDDKEIWKMLRRELIQDGISSRVVRTHMETIKKYVTELGARGVLDDAVTDDVAENEVFEEGVSLDEAKLDVDSTENYANESIEESFVDKLDQRRQEADSKISSGASASPIRAEGAESQAMPSEMAQESVYSAMDPQDGEASGNDSSANEDSDEDDESEGCNGEEIAQLPPSTVQALNKPATNMEEGIQALEEAARTEIMPTHTGLPYREVSWIGMITPLVSSQTSKRDWTRPNVTKTWWQSSLKATLAFRKKQDKLSIRDNLSRHSREQREAVYNLLEDCEEQMKRQGVREIELCVCDSIKIPDGKSMRTAYLSVLMVWYVKYEGDIYIK